MEQETEDQMQVQKFSTRKIIDKDKMFNNLFHMNLNHIPMNDYNTIGSNMKTFWTVKNEKSGSSIRVPANLCNFNPSGMFICRKWSIHKTLAYIHCFILTYCQTLIFGKITVKNLIKNRNNMGSTKISTIFKQKARYGSKTQNACQ